MTATKINIEDLPTKYDAQETEGRIYKFWEEGGYFKADNKSKTYQDVVKAGGFKDLSNPEDQTEIKDETINYVANGYIQILKQIGE